MIFRKRTPANTSLFGWLQIGLLATSLPLAAIPSPQAPEPAPAQENKTAPAAPEQEEELDPEEIQRKVDEAIEISMDALEKIDIAEVVRISLENVNVNVAEIVEKSLEAVEIALESAAIEETIERSLNEMELRIDEAVEAAREAGTQVDVQVEIEKCLAELDVRKIASSFLVAGLVLARRLSSRLLGQDELAHGSDGREIFDQHLPGFDLNLEGLLQEAH